MIIWLAGMSCVGKSTIMRNIISKFPEGEKVRPTKYFDCIKFDNFITIGGRYYNKTTNPGSDYIFAGKDKFQDFITQEYPKHKKMLIEGSKFFRPEIISWLMDNNYKLKIYYLSTDINNLNQRAKNRGGWWDKKRTEKRTLSEIKRLEKILTNKTFSSIIEQRTNETMEQSTELSLHITNMLMDKFT
tara:strand:- start:78 stop:638 length:561 start_codon:yes stop_codon:yes gene_type:complete